ncbi:hypothetical protein FHU14_001986 [Mesorhizobium sp. RMAD-H1]|nr:hypothetical protein [Mesorhizobium sp. RMAD-H1]
MCSSGYRGTESAHLNTCFRRRHVAPQAGNVHSSSCSRMIIQFQSQFMRRRNTTATFSRHHETAAVYEVGNGGSTLPVSRVMYERRFAHFRVSDGRCGDVAFCHRGCLGHRVSSRSTDGAVPGSPLFLQGVPIKILDPAKCTTNTQQGSSSCPAEGARPEKRRVHTDLNTRAVYIHPQQACLRPEVLDRDNFACQWITEANLESAGGTALPKRTLAALPEDGRKFGSIYARTMLKPSRDGLELVGATRTQLWEL